MNQLVHSGRRRGAGRPAAKPAPRANDPELTMADILAVATREFAEKGLAGARIDVVRGDRPCMNP